MIVAAIKFEDVSKLAHLANAAITCVEDGTMTEEQAIACLAEEVAELGTMEVVYSRGKKAGN